MLTPQYSDANIMNQDNSDYTWLDKVFSKMETDSFKLSLFLMVVSSMSLAIFMIHTVFAKIGIMFGCVAILLISFVFMKASEILVHSLKFASNINSISEVVEVILGKTYQCLYNNLLILYFFGQCIIIYLAFLLTSYDTFGNVFLAIFQIEDKSFQKFKWIYSWISTGVMLFVAFFQDIQSFKFPSFIILITFSYFFLLTLIVFPLDYFQLSKNQQIIYNNKVQSPQAVIISSGVIFFGYNCLSNFFSKITFVGNPRVQNTKKIFQRSFLLLSNLYIVFGLMSYLSLGQEEALKHQLYIFSFKSSNFLFFFAKIVLLVSIMFQFGIVTITFKTTFYQFFETEINNRNNIIFGLIFVVLIQTITLFINDIYALTGLIGTFPGFILIITYPCLLANKIQFNESRTGKVLESLLVILSLLSMGLSIFSYIMFNQQNLKKLIQYKKLQIRVNHLIKYLIILQIKPDLQFTSQLSFLFLKNNQLIYQNNDNQITLIFICDKV